MLMKEVLEVKLTIKILERSTRRLLLSPHFDDMSHRVQQLVHSSAVYQIRHRYSAK